MSRTTIEFRCPECGQSNTQSIPVPDVDWAADPGDSWVNDTVDIRCNHCAEPLALDVENTPSHCAVSIQEHANVHVSVDGEAFWPDDDHEDWEKFELPDNPHDVLQRALASIEKLVRLHQERSDTFDGPEITRLLRRMAHAQIVASMEAYLADTLIKAAELPEVQGRLAAKAPVLRDIKLTLADMLAAPDRVASTIRAHLRQLTYHNLEQINPYFDVGMSVTVFGDKERTSRLHRAVTSRHDIVHRNGKDKDGNLLVVDLDALTQLAADVRSLASDVEAQASSIVSRSN